MLIIFTFIYIFLIRQIHSQNLNIKQENDNSLLFRLFDYHNILTDYNLKTQQQNPNVLEFNSHYVRQPILRLATKLKKKEQNIQNNHTQNIRFRNTNETNEKENKRKPLSKNNLDEDDEDNGLSVTLRQTLKQLKKENKKPLIPLHSVQGLNFNDKEQLKSQSCTTVTQEDLEAIQSKDTQMLTQEQLDLENQKLENATQIDLTDLFCKDIFNTITRRIESEYEAKNSKKQLEQMIQERNELQKRYQEMDKQTQQQITELKSNLSAKNEQLENEVANQKKEIERQRQLQYFEQQERERNFRLTMKKLDQEKILQQKRIIMQKRHEDSLMLMKVRGEYIDRVTRQTEEMQRQYQLLLKEQPGLLDIQRHINQLIKDNQQVNQDITPLDIQITKRELDLFKDKRLQSQLNSRFLLKRMNDCRYKQSCEECVASRECGWCQQDLKCVQGDGMGALDPVCSQYEYAYCSSSRCVESRTCQQCLQNSKCFWCQAYNLCMLYQLDFIPDGSDSQQCPFGAINVQSFQGQATLSQIKNQCNDIQ